MATRNEIEPNQPTESKALAIKCANALSSVCHEIIDRLQSGDKLTNTLAAVLRPLEQEAVLLATKILPKIDLVDLANSLDLGSFMPGEHKEPPFIHHPTLEWTGDDQLFSPEPGQSPYELPHIPMPNLKRPPKAKDQVQPIPEKSPYMPPADDPTYTPIAETLQKKTDDKETDEQKDSEKDTATEMQKIDTAVDKLQQRFFKGDKFTGTVQDLVKELEASQQSFSPQEFKAMVEKLAERSHERLSVHTDKQGLIERVTFKRGEEEATVFNQTWLKEQPKFD